MYPGISILMQKVAFFSLPIFLAGLLFYRNSYRCEPEDVTLNVFIAGLLWGLLVMCHLWYLWAFRA